jgi:hypothetical protein
MVPDRTDVSPPGGARGGLERSPASWMAGNAGADLRRRQSGREGEVERNEARGVRGALAGL